MSGIVERVRRAGLALAAAAALALAAPSAAEERSEFWPELNLYVRLGEVSRLFLFAASTRAQETVFKFSGSEYMDHQFGVNFDLTLSPVFRQQLAEGDWQRNRYLWMRIGYVYSGAPGGSDEEHRGLLELNSRTPPGIGELELLGRLKWEARDISGERSNRYMLRLGVERSMRVLDYAVVPYADAETSYDTRYDTWNRQRYRIGAEVVLDRHWRVEPSLIRQNDSRSQTSRVNALGLALKYFH